MKGSVIALIVLGAVAALSVSVLVGALRSDGASSTAAEDQEDRMTSIVVAARELAAGTIIDGDAVATQQLKVQDAPEGSMRDPVQAVGKVITTAMVKGQVFLATNFASEGSGLHLAAALPRGMRAVAISLTAASALRGLLYPGCKVDVLWARNPGRNETPVSKLLLERVNVLGIEDRTIVSSRDPKDAKPRSGRTRMVTLMLNIAQAKQLHAADRLGSISLVLRHPLDNEVAVAIEELDEQRGPDADTFSTEVINGKSSVGVTYVNGQNGWRRQL
ncbi:MAG: Flp pilus assembly protein CpaB [Planctomycetota bacterium]|nr:Flp pilus assembly protein CpaB [Planctomycetota bacterium]